MRFSNDVPRRSGCSQCALEVKTLIENEIKKMVEANSDFFSKDDLDNLKIKVTVEEEAENQYENLKLKVTTLKPEDISEFVTNNIDFDEVFDKSVSLRSILKAHGLKGCNPGVALWFSTDGKQERSNQGRNNSLCTRCIISSTDVAVGDQHCTEPTDGSSACDTYSDLTLEITDFNAAAFQNAFKSSPSNDYKKFRTKKCKNYGNQETTTTLRFNNTKYGDRKLHDNNNCATKFKSGGEQTSLLLDDAAKALGLKTNDWDLSPLKKTIENLEKNMKVNDKLFEKLKTKISNLKKKKVKITQRIQTLQKQIKKNKSSSQNKKNESEQKQNELEQKQNELKNILIEIQKEKSEISKCQKKINQIESSWQTKRKLFYESQGPFEKRYNKFLNDAKISRGRKMIVGDEALSLFKNWKSFSQIYKEIQFTDQKGDIIILGSNEMSARIAHFCAKKHEMNQLQFPVIFFCFLGGNTISTIKNNFLFLIVFAPEIEKKT